MTIGPDFRIRRDLNLPRLLWKDLTASKLGAGWSLETVP